MMETIDLDVEEPNELLFKVKVEGVEPAPAKVRLVCESGDLAYMFLGRPTGDEGVVQFLLPILKGKLKEGTYPSKVEVLIENRYFAPVLFNINFKQAIKVVAEAVQVPRKAAPAVSVAVTAVAVKKPIAMTKPVVLVSKPAIIEGTSRTTLKERFETKRSVTQVIEKVDTEGEELIRDLARSFVRGNKK